MKKILIIGIAVVLLVIAGRVLLRNRSNDIVVQPPTPTPTPTPSPFTLKAGDYKFSLNHGGLTRTYLAHVPPSYKTTQSLSVIINFHGGGHHAEGMRDQSGMNKNSDKNGYIAAYPNGTSSGGKNLTWNGGNCCGYAVKNNVDDVGLTLKIIQDLSSKFNINQKRVYVTGYSNGGGIAYRLAREIPNSIAAIAPMAVTPFMEPISKAVPILHFHGELDKCALFNGGQCGGCFGSETRACEPVVSAFKALAGIYQCNPNPQVDTSRKNVICSTYSGCLSNTEVKLCSIADGGHVWPGSSNNSLTPKIIGPDTFSLDANEEMWEFFQKHPMP